MFLLHAALLNVATYTEHAISGATWTAFANQKQTEKGRKKEEKDNLKENVWPLG